MLRAYPGGVGNCSYSYDRRGRLASVSQSGTATALEYNDAGQWLKASYTGGTLSGFSLTNGYDACLRKGYVAVRAPSGTWYGAATYGYDNASRLSTVTGPATVSYSYLANSPLVGNVTFEQSGATNLTVSRTYDYLNRLLSIASAPTGAGPLNYGYTYNDGNQRMQMTLADGSFWLYEYDALGQVKSGKRYWSDWTPVAGQQFEYGFDDIGNRNWTKVGGDSIGSALRSASYTPNNLNQYSSRTVPGAADVLGIANMAASVTVNNQAAYRKGEYFQNALAITNGSGPAYQAVTTKAVNGSSSNTVSGNILLAAANESYGYDLDGNLTSDGLWSYTWNAENQLVTMQSVASVPTAAKRKLDFEYDWQGRRIKKEVRTTTDGLNYINPVTTKYLYDGWNLLAEFDGNNALVRSYYWGLDLSGAREGAGGVGGLVAVTTSAGTTYYPAFDGNGNVVAYVTASNGQLAAQCEYGPFGEVIRATGSISPAIPIRWSTKYTDLETDLVYYGYRYYNPSTGRWTSRDPIESDDQHNQYIFAANRPTDAIDILGQWRLLWNGNWAGAEKVQLWGYINRARDRAAVVAKQVQDEIANETGRKAPSCYINELSGLLTLLNNMVKDANGSATVRVYKDVLPLDTAATAWHARTIFNAKLTINTRYRYKNSTTVGFALNGPDSDVLEAIFHELSHLSKPYSSDGGDNPLNDASNIEELASRDLGTLTVIIAARKCAYPCK